MYRISMNQPLNLDELMALITRTYWASDRSKIVMSKALSHSEYITVYNKEELVGFSRIVTDYSTMFWLCDLVVKPLYRGQGIGKMMMTHLQAQPYYKALKGVLATRDAHDLYTQYGFEKEADKAMMKPRETEG